MPDEKFDPSRRHALPGLSTVSVASAGAGTGACFSHAESTEDNTLTAGEPDFYVYYVPAVDRDEAGGETGAALSDDGEVMTSLDRREPIAFPDDHREIAFPDDHREIAFPDDHRDDVSYASPTTVVGPSGIFQTNDSLIGIPGFDSSTGRPPRRPEVAGPGRPAHGLP